MNVYLNLCRYKILQKECRYYFYLNLFDQNQNHNVLPKMKCFVHVTVIIVTSILHIVGKSTLSACLMLLSSIKTIRAQWIYRSRPSQTAHCLKIRDRIWGTGGGSGRLAIR